MPVDIDPDNHLRRVLDLRGSGARTTEDIFVGESLPTPGGRIFGGQVLGQAVIAASRTLTDDRHLHSMHGYFLRPGISSDDITFSVDRIHDGRSFSTRRAQAFQNGVPIFSMIASFQVDDVGIEHFLPMPRGVPQPEELVTNGMPHDPSDSPASFDVDLRRLRDHDPDMRGAWARSSTGLPDSPKVHNAALAFLSDLVIQDPVLDPHDISWAHPGLKVASLDHAMWFHRPARADDWLLFLQDSPNARGGRGLAMGRVYDRAGTLVASVAQEIMVRVPL